MAAVTRYWNGVGADNAFATAGNWVDAAAPVSTDTVIFPAMASASGVIVDGSDQSAILLVATIVEPSCALTFGSRGIPLELDTDAFTYEGSGASYFDIASCAELRIYSAASGDTTNSYGFNLTGTSNTLLIVDPGSSGSVSLASLGDESLACVTIQIVSGTVDMGDSLTVTTLYVDGGTVSSKTDVTTLQVAGGTFRQLKNNPTTLNVLGGRVYYNSTDVPTTVTLRGSAILDMSEDGRAKTWQTVNLYDSARIYDPGNVLTITTLNRYKGGTLSVS